MWFRCAPALRSSRTGRPADPNKARCRARGARSRSAGCTRGSTASGPAGGRSRLGTQSITGAAHRFDATVWVFVVELGAQRSDMDVDGVGQRRAVVVPDVVGDHVTGQHVIGISHQVFEDAKFFLTELD